MRTANVAVVALLVGCAHAQPPAEPAAQQAAKPAPPAPPPAPAAKPVEAARKAAPTVSPASIYFDFDKSLLKPGARTVLQEFYDAVQKRPALHVRIEGNCDERGTEEYNLALGQRRADAAKKYLERLGLDASRITTVSNGKEKPRALGHDEDSWRENRRDDLLPGNNAVGQPIR